MATTNLISKTLGSVLLQSGNGIPDHAAPKGSMYTNIDSGNIWTNIDGSTSWEQLVRSAYGEINMSATTTTSPSTSTFTQVTSNMVLRTANGFTLGTGALQLSANRDGRYGVLMTCTLRRNAVTSFYDVGVSLNSAVPISGRFQGCSVDTTHTDDNVSVYSTVDLVANDRIGLALKASSAGNVDIIKFSLVSFRISD